MYLHTKIRKNTILYAFKYSFHDKYAGLSYLLLRQIPETAGASCIIIAIVIYQQGRFPVIIIMVLEDCGFTFGQWKNPHPPGAY